MKNAFAEESHLWTASDSASSTPIDMSPPAETPAEQPVSITETAPENTDAVVDTQQGTQEDMGEQHEAATTFVPMAGETNAEVSATPTAEAIVPPVAEKGISVLPWVLVLLALVVAVSAVVLLLRTRKQMQKFRKTNGHTTQPMPGARTPRAPRPDHTTPNMSAGPRPKSYADRTDRAMPKMPPSNRATVQVKTAVGSTESKSHYFIGAAQIIGRREYQEDSYCFSPLDAKYIGQHGLFAAVADGIGGLNNGEIASNTVLRNMCANFDRQDASLPLSDRLLDLVGHGQKDVLELNRKGYQCGTTLVSVMIQHGEFAMLSVGDSRIALYRSDMLLQLNREHVLDKTDDKNAALNHGLSETGSRQRKAVTAYLGKENLRTVDRTLNPTRLLPGDRLLLMSDGIFEAINDDEIISSLHLSPNDAAKAIVKAVEAKRLPHQDNATIVIVAYD